MIQYAIENYVYSPFDFEEIGFGVLYKMYQKKELMFYGIYIKGYATLWAPIQYSEELEVEIPQIFVDEHIFTESEFSTPEILSVFGLWIDIQSLLNEIIVYINNNLGKYNLLENQFNHKLCQKCGGKCCLNSGCYFAPSDFTKNQLTFQYLFHEMKKGYMSIVLLDSRYTGLQPIFILKVRNENDGVVALKLSDGRCILHTSNGCLFGDDKRPYGGRTLIPMKHDNCIGIYTFRQAAEDWLPYQKLLYELVEAFYGLNISFKGLY